eukprot:TRINITY_DN760_c0_g1_i5.p1 TRINITY_DN760_c0_g1~~TRINITY_DN760_c0_g1_i5.p1  ORF type:complete len:369 (-),score=82.86 TRINITY_DN760_c0_g1_i5:71-1177(-)
MPIFSSRAFDSGGEPVKASRDYEREADEGEKRLIICACDYKGSSCQLTCTQDGENMKKFAAACGISDVEVLYDNQMTRDNVIAKIKEVGARCGEDDYFIFYYSGHGSQVPDEDGDEEDGKDEALCTVGPGGRLAARYFLTDDDFAEVVTESLDEQVRIVILSDCCHSGTIGDLEKDCWKGREVCTMSGCADNQTSGDMGRGGIFTHSMLLAAQRFSDNDETDYSVGELYNGTLLEDDKVFKSAQDIQMRAAPGLTPNKMAWPLVPQAGYKAPLTQATDHVSQVSGGDEQAMQHTMMNNPQLLQMFGLPAGVASMMQSGNLDLSHVQHGSEDWMADVQQLSAMCASGGLENKQTQSFIMQKLTGGCSVM